MRSRNTVEGKATHQSRIQGTGDHDSRDKERTGLERVEACCIRRGTENTRHRVMIFFAQNSKTSICPDFLEEAALEETPGGIFCRRPFADRREGGRGGGRKLQFDLTSSRKLPLNNTVVFSAGRLINFGVAG